jgi:hypothetical protein
MQTGNGRKAGTQIGKGSSEAGRNEREARRAGRKKKALMQADGKNSGWKIRERRQEGKLAG